MSSATENKTSSQTPQSPSTSGAVTAAKKKRPEDFKFGKILGEGSYSTVVLGKEIATNKEYAVKILEKRHIIREKKVQYVSREKEVLSRLNHPFFVKLFFTFQDSEKLYFGLSYAKKGELLPYITRLGSFDENCTRFYSAEVVLALEHLHKLGIIHRDLKPENILLNEQMHIQITDFGTAKILDKDEDMKKGRNSFVGTAQYVSPELLTDKRACKSSDLWALGCIVYQLLSGLPPFRASNEYQIFQKIINLDYTFPQGFPETPKDLVEKLLLLDPTKRIGSDEMGGYDPLKKHLFYEAIDWDSLPEQNPPKLLPYLPPTCSEEEELRSIFNAPSIDSEEEFDDSLLARWNLIDNGVVENKKPAAVCVPHDEKEKLLAIQARESKWHPFVGDNLILKSGIVDKRKGLFAKRRQLLLTEGPHLIYIDPSAMVIKGEIPWTKDLRAEAVNFKVFFVHTPNRTYYLMDPECFAMEWVKKIQEIHKQYFPTSS